MIPTSSDRPSVGQDRPPVGDAENHLHHLAD
nr:MAG TPA: hypothetical protein [Caudoviricetes sp.]